MRRLEDANNSACENTIIRSTINIIKMATLTLFSPQRI